MLLGARVGNLFPCTLEVLPVEKPRSGLDALAAGKPIHDGSRDELVDGHLIGEKPALTKSLSSAATSSSESGRRAGPSISPLPLLR